MASGKIDKSSFGLIRGLGAWAAVAIVVGAMVGQAVFLVASDMGRVLGSPMKVLAAWIVGGIIVLCGGFCFAELGAAIPEAGGAYLYLSRGLGPVWGFLYGWTSAMIMRPGSGAIIAAGLLRFAAFLLPSLNTPIFVWHIWIPFQTHSYQFTFAVAQLLAAAMIGVVTSVNYFGVRTAGRFQIFLTSLKVTAVVGIVILGFTLGKAVGIPSESPIAPPYVGLGAFLTALVPVMAAYNGFSVLGEVGGEIENPRRNLRSPRYWEYSW